MSIVLISVTIPSVVFGDPQFNYDESKSLVDNALDNCASSSGWLTSLKSLIQMSPSKENCDEVMVALYKFCYKSVGVLEGLAEGFGRTIQPGSLAGNVKEKCSDERILNYGYPGFRTLLMSAI